MARTVVVTGNGGGNGQIEPVNSLATLRSNDCRKNSRHSDLDPVAMAKVSVLTPTYQHAGFIGDCIRGVLAQTEPDWEMVIVDDGSDDGTPEIAESFNDPRITVVRLEHEGVTGLSRIYATALAKSSAPIVAVLEGDDTWPATKLEVELPLFEDPSVVLAYGPAGLIDEKGCLYARFWHAPRGTVALNQPIGAILPSLVQVNFIVAATVMIRRSALDQIGGFIQPDGISYLDHPTWLRLATIGTFARASSDVGNWRRYARQVTTRSWFDAVPDRSAYLESIEREAENVATPEVRSALATTIRRDASRQREDAMIARGRVALLEGSWKEAASLFTQVIRTAEPRNRLVAALGLACSLMRTDMERVISARGRHSLPSRRHRASHREVEPRSWSS
jgi:glycosyltransferase involved in cell wall biosynthesis